MTKVTIDNKDYEFESLSENAKAQLQSLRFVDSELAKIQAQAAILQTARNAYANALKTELDAQNGTRPSSQGDELVFAPPSVSAEEAIQTSSWKGFFKK